MSTTPQEQRNRLLEHIVGDSSTLYMDGTEVVCLRRPDKPGVRPGHTIRVADKGALRDFFGYLIDEGYLLTSPQEEQK